MIPTTGGWLEAVDVGSDMMVSKIPYRRQSPVSSEELAKVGIAGGCRDLREGLRGLQTEASTTPDEHIFLPNASLTVYSDRIMSETPPSLDPTLCRARQDRLRQYLDQHDFDGAVLFNRHYVYSLTGYWHGQPLTPTAVAVERDGKVLLVTHDASPHAPAADEVLAYVPNDYFTLRPNLSGNVTEVLNPRLSQWKRAAVEQQVPSALISGPQCVDITTDYQYIRRKKDADEVAAVEFTINCADRVYGAAKEILEPGTDEADLMAALQEVATRAAGEFLSGWGQDFQAGSPGGLARPGRKAQAGELMPLDIGVGVRGYRTDLCRTFAVDRQPTDEQYAAYEHIVKTMKLGESLMKPGQSCKEFYKAIHAELEGWQGYSFFHHAGHGIGLDAHEVPRLNPAWDDTFEEGDLVAFEPGLYGDKLNAGIRLENNYLITAEGMKQLSFFPLDLA